ncbi:hypothetical protein PR202_ga06695 [Eleusine coracana subsp. coracana]|uniref:Uncharacterized protein n=1 Tax=Eleusine coracana subsp. coracana TaxID=191504 RepID=A0AAV5BY36_ELECO|nr:hypothetical protein PR202_ga06695 [Eleusine coracana subsp. coracana]
MVLSTLRARNVEFTPFNMGRVRPGGGECAPARRSRGPWWSWRRGAPQGCDVNLEAETLGAVVRIRRKNEMCLHPVACVTPRSRLLRALHDSFVLVPCVW